MSEVSGNPVYREKSETVLKRLMAMRSSITGLLPAYIDAHSDYQSSQGLAQFVLFPFIMLNVDFTMGGLADSYYEYLLKMWLYSGKRDDRYHDLFAASVNVSH